VNLGAGVEIAAVPYSLHGDHHRAG